MLANTTQADKLQSNIQISLVVEEKSVINTDININQVVSDAKIGIDYSGVVMLEPLYETRIENTRVIVRTIHF